MGGTREVKALYKSFESAEGQWLLCINKPDCSQRYPRLAGGSTIVKHVMQCEMNKETAKNLLAMMHELTSRLPKPFVSFLFANAHNCFNGSFVEQIEEEVTAVFLRAAMKVDTAFHFQRPQTVNPYAAVSTAFPTQEPKSMIVQINELIFSDLEFLFDIARELLQYFLNPKASSRKGQKNLFLGIIVNDLIDRKLTPEKHGRLAFLLH
jgi:hypothetical protein